MAHPRLHATQTPDKPALILADTGERLSYRQLVENADRAARLYHRLGVQEGEVIAILLENQLRYPEVCWAAKNSGLYYACISSQLNVADAEYIVRNSGAKLLVTSRALADTACALAARLGGAVTLLMIDGAVAPFLPYEELLAREEPAPLAGRRRGASMLYSSGTTGRPKGIKMPLLDAPPQIAPARHAVLLAQYHFSETTVFLNPGPFYHAGPLRFMMTVQRTGGTVVGNRKFDPETTLRSIERYRATHGLFVPTMFNRMLKLPAVLRDSVDTSSMRYAVHAAAPCPIAVKEAMLAWWGPVIYELYAGTEGIGTTFIGPLEWQEHKGSVGRVPSSFEISIRNDAGEAVPPFTPGLIYLRNGASFEYHGDPEKTRSVRTPDGWTTLGDVGYLDADGFLYLTDRQSHMIICGGVNIYPQEAEDILASHPAVADVAVIGIPHDDFGEEVKAVVLPVEMPADPTVLAEALLAYCRSRLTAIKCPRSVDFVQSLPRNEMGKLLKRELKKRYWAGRSTLIA